MKKFFKFAAVAAITAMFVSCTEKPGPDTDKPNNPDNPDTPEVEITEDLTFTLEVTEVEIDKAKVKVEHNGTTKDTWYAFATTDTDVNAAIAAKVAELKADGDKIVGLKKNTSTTITVRSLEQDTDYTFIAFGITPEGELYGTAASTTFKTEKEEVVPPTPPAPDDLTAGYSAWLGDWTFTGANGISQNVTFSIGEANKTFLMSGYEGLPADYAVIVDWSEEYQAWEIWNQELGTVKFNDGSEGTLWFLGEDAEGHLYLSELPICQGGMLEDGTLAALPFEGDLEMQDGSTLPYLVNDMLYIAYLGGTSLSYVTSTFQTGYPTFPITITPTTKATTCAVKEFKGGKKTLNSLTPKTFNTFSVCEKSIRTL